MLEPSTIFNTVASFMTNTNLQHYSGDQHLSNFSQTFFILPNMFLSASVGFCAFSAIIRAFRGEATVGNFFVDMWRVCMYIYLPAALIFGVLLIQQGMPMTYASAEVATTLVEPGAMGNDDKGQAKPQTIIVGPVAATLRRTRIATSAFRRLPNRSVEKVSSADLRLGDIVVVDENQVISWRRRSRRGRWARQRSGDPRGIRACH